MKGKISFQCVEGAYVCQILPSGAVLIDALAGQGVKFHKSPTSDNHFFGLKLGEFSSLRALAQEKGEIDFSPLDQVSGAGFRVSESALSTCLGKIYADRARTAAAATLAKLKVEEEERERLKTFEDLILEKISAGGMSRVDAIKTAVNEQPGKHDAYIERLKSGIATKKF